jgi:hypothetical protein
MCFLIEIQEGERWRERMKRMKQKKGEERIREKLLLAT